MAHLDNTDHYRVYDGEDRPLKFGHAETAFDYVIENNAERVTIFNHRLSSEDDLSEFFATTWLKNQPEVPAILPDFIKRHLPPEAIEAKRNQQLKGMR